MNTSQERYTVTAALPYANGYKHIGHLAGAYLPADIFVRHLRAKKKDVLFVCGSDENGAAITLQAIHEQKTPKAIVDFYHPILENDFRTLGISFDVYHRTSDELHHKTAKAFFEDLLIQKKLEKKEEEQFFDQEANIFLADRYIQGCCPNCQYDAAYGDQCEKCGSSLSPQELINPKSTLTKSTPVLKKTTHYYLPLNLYESFISEWMSKNAQKGWKNNVVGQCTSWLKDGLHSRAVTRDLNWGVKIKIDDIEKVLYVWFDAPIGYISATKQWAMDNHKDWEPYWKDDNTKLIHFIGKDNIVFHCIIFPVMLHLNGYILPEAVPANEFVNLEGNKMSTSRDWKLNIKDYIDDFVHTTEADNTKMIDALRYYLIQIMPETKDSEFTWKKFQTANNSELVAIWGNYLYRTWILTHKLCNGRIPPLHKDILDSTDEALIDFISNHPPVVSEAITNYKFREGINLVMEVARRANKYLQEKEPWIVQKTLEKTPENQQVIDNTLHLCLQVAANMAILINPFLPFTAKSMCKQMKVVEKMLEWENAGKLDLLKVNYPLPAPEMLFENIDDEPIQQQIDKLNNMQISTNTTNSAETSSSTSVQPKPIAPIKPNIDFETFERIDLRVATIIGAERVEKTDKLLKLLVDLGFEKRTIVSGIAHLFDVEMLIGQRVIVVANLASKKLRGVESHGMILLGKNPNGKLYFLTPEKDSHNGDVCR